jgi:hypothetical protein
MVTFGTSKSGGQRREQEKRKYPVYRENIVAFYVPEMHADAKLESKTFELAVVQYKLGDSGWEINGTKNTQFRKLAKFYLR